MVSILREAETDAELLHEAPHTQPVRRLDEVRAAKHLDLVWSGTVG
jgi:glycine dehydrogenase subunit 2